MDIRFFRSAPDAPVAWPQQEASSPDKTVALVPLERHNDPDAINRIGFDFYGAYGDGEHIDQWAENQPLEAIDRDELPAQLTWFPAPFINPED